MVLWFILKISKGNLGILTAVIVLVSLWVDCTSVHMVPESAMIHIISEQLNKPFDSTSRHAKFLLLLTFHCL